jgi:hypothetical protein
MRNPEREWRTPKAFRSHKTTAITTTIFRMLLIEPAIGMKLFTSQRRKPITIKTATRWIKGIINLPIATNFSYSAQDSGLRLRGFSFSNHPYALLIPLIPSSHQILADSSRNTSFIPFGGARVSSVRLTRMVKTAHSGRLVGYKFPYQKY